MPTDYVRSGQNVKVSFLSSLNSLYPSMLLVGSAVESKVYIRVSTYVFAAAAYFADSIS